MKAFWPFIAVIASLHVIAATKVETSTSSYLSKAELTRLKKVLEPGLQLKDISEVYHAVLGYSLAKETIPNVEGICKFALSSVGDGTNVAVETIFYATSVWQTTGKCQPLPVPAITKVLTKIVEKDTSTIPELYYAVGALKHLSHKLPEATITKLVKTLQSALKKDDSVSNLGYTFHIAADLGSPGAFAFERIEDAIVQADEVNGQYLQFEGGLSVTSLVVNGVFKLSSSLNKKPPLTSQQIVKLANYLLSRVSVQTPKGVISLLSALTTLATNEFEKPTCITLAEGGMSISVQQPLVKVKVCDILGNPLEKVPTVTAKSVTKLKGEAVAVNKKKFEPSQEDKTLFTLDLMDAKLSRGFYQISISAGLVSNTVTVKVLSEAVIDYLEIGIGDADQTTQPKLIKVKYPNKLEEKIEADSQQKLVMRFALKDSTKKTIRTHQAFVKLSPAADSTITNKDHEIIFVAETSLEVYKFDMPVGPTAGNFGHESGDYNVELIVGDALLSNSFQWRVAVVTLKFPEAPTFDVSVPSDKFAPFQHKNNMYTPKPEIKHMFREPEKRPPAFVSNLFTGLCLAPVLLLFILWAKLGVNISNFPLSLSAVVFHLGLGSIFVLFGVFWLKLNMFVTLRYLMGLGVVTFLAGNKLLSHIARTRKGR
ncbi:dolichyl-diphosphooligosaccharide--protein glycosyltransferase subunit 2 isoform X2 [Orussus abietinus]|uniref:dolichyl-diphosphooligosaccharide--protein glycosyltransferase subunit 2 isoform X2 n=1 Tax=Orussus abietinus TaxID=222816 RepID=UPI000C715DC3|nr:dolichyl-diphosphooligosaccharide--protein glycosyltransferase subunit 2 isoform X2 [Orussus abietinus]